MQIQEIRLQVLSAALNEDVRVVAAAGVGDG